MWQFWIDRGGTFTDIVAQRPDRQVVTHKLLSENPQRYSDAPLQGIRDLMGLGPEDPIPAEQIALIKMGTTVATNALLERQGEPTVLLITAGFGDALAIGYQNRPDIFALQIQKPELLYDRVIEVPERLSAQGEVLQPLDLAAVETPLRQAYAEGLRSCAIVLLHGYAYPQHEQKLANLAKLIGFPQVSVSHKVSPLIKLISRGDTTVVDAYLSPVLRRYVDRVTAGLGESMGQGKPRGITVAEEGNHGGIAPTGGLNQGKNGGITVAEEGNHGGIAATEQGNHGGFAPTDGLNQGNHGGIGATEQGKHGGIAPTDGLNQGNHGGFAPTDGDRTKKGPKLLFMQSNGGLTAAEAFQGKDSLLSGPAGGLVGAVQVCRAAGFEQVITFDMGGTSTDVAHYNSEYERQWETELAGVRLRAPILAIHTVAAGGGSILRFESDRFQVGPTSAGAYPGPAAYGQGGPLTVTDANVQLGYLQPQFFPQVFGADGRQSLDKEAVQQQFKDLAELIRVATGIDRSAAAIAAGFRAIAIENMANAIQKISVQRGYDLSDYVLCCFGAAGGQHACALAQRLGMGKILIHPYSGILSAYGMGVADRRLLKEKSLEKALNLENLGEINQLLQELAQQGQQELEHQGIPDVVAIDRLLRLHLRYAGSDSPLAISWPLNSPLLANPKQVLSQITQDFTQQHQQRYGFVLPDQALVVAMGEAEIIGRTGVMDQGAAPEPQQEEPEIAAIVDCCFGEVWQQTSVYQRQNLGQGCEIVGPALIIEAIGTNVIEPGWQAIVTDQGNLLLEPRPIASHADAAPPAATQQHPGLSPTGSPTADPVLLEIFNNRLMAIAEQMGFTLENTSHSVNIKERLDFSCAIFDSAGQLVANAPHIPVHLGSMGEAVQALRQHHGKALPPGTVYVSNNPYNGGTHLPDITVITPVFLSDAGQLVPTATEPYQPHFYVASRGHHADIGGITPGSMPAQSQTLAEEGILLDNEVLVKAGVLQREALYQRLTQGAYPARNPEQNLADLQAQVAANEKGAQELAKLVQQYGWEIVKAYLGYVQDNGEAAVRGAIDRLIQAHRSQGEPRSAQSPAQSPVAAQPSQASDTPVELRSQSELDPTVILGPFRVEMDSGAGIQVKITLNAATQSATLDFNGTSPQQPTNSNAPLAVCKAVVLYVFRTLVPDPIPLNAGCLRPLTLVVPPGCLLNPQPPAAVVAGNVETSQALADALYGALGVLAASQGTMNNLTFGNDRAQYYETLCGGSGAGPDFPGCDAVQTHMTNSRITDPEVLEQRFPVQLLEFKIRRGSGGMGHYPGGCGAVRRLRFQESLTVNLLSDRRRIAPFGLAGGQPGAVGVNRLDRADGSRETLAGTATIAVEAGDILTLETPGGGGFGKSP
ncbi:MAG: hydantoinase B/oxoprolinase family protein [Prochlorothrix sp.]